MAVRAHQGIETAIKQWQPTIDALNNKITEHSFTLIPMLSLTEITKQTELKAFDFVLTNPSSYVEINLLYNAKALATLNNKRENTAQSQFGSVIFTHARNSHILNIKDLKNKTLMAVSKPAFGGWRVAWLEMLKQGFDPIAELKSLKFTKSKAQPEVVYAVLNGEVDAGVVRTDLLERLEAKNKIDMRYLRILNNKDIVDFPFFLSTPLYPEWAFTSLKHIPVSIAQRVSQNLMAIQPDSRAAKKGKYIGWIPPKDYSSVNKLMQTLNVGPYEK